MGKKQSNLVVTKDLLKNGWKVAGIFLATRVCPTWQRVLPFETSAFCCLFKTHFTPNAPPFNSFTSVEKQLVVWCPHLPGRLQVPCKLSLGSQDVSSGNTNTKSSLQDEKKNVWWIKKLVLTNNAHPWGVYSQTWKTVNTRNISGMLLSCKRKANQVWEN